MRPKLSVNIGKLKLKNPVMVCSGTFGYAQDFRDFLNLKVLGAIVTKTVTLRPRQGNPPPRTCETPAGMLNSIGLENPGLEIFIRENLPELKKLGVPIIMSIASELNPQDFITIAKCLDKITEIQAIELNISCPNIKNPKSNDSSRLTIDTERRRSAKIQNPKLISQDPKATFDLVSKVRKVTKKILITKLSPNVTDITEIALAAERAGSDAVSLINTLTGMSIDINTKKPNIACITGGLSGPAIRPVALRMVWEVYQKIKIPIIGMGGIMDSSSALEFFIAGATCVSIGTANFINPKVTLAIIRGLREYLIKNKIKDIKTITGSFQT